MASIGVIVVAQQVPASATTPSNTANAFMIGVSDWGPVGASGVNAPITSLGQFASSFCQPNGGVIQNARNTLNATLYDSADAFFREGGGNLFVSRVLGPSPTFGTLGLQDSTGGTAATLTAAYYGSGSSGINVVVVNAIGDAGPYQVVLQDTNGNTIASSPSTLAATSAKTDLISWAAGTGLVTATTGNSKAPKAVGVLAASGTNPLSPGSDNRSGGTPLTNWTNALNQGFSYNLGSGQVMAPGQTNTSLAGIWNALGVHAQSNNRVALLDGTDGNTATAAIAELTTAALSSSLDGYCGLWVGNLVIPGITSGTTRSISPSPVVAALCARADAQGNPNQAAAGTGFPLQYVSSLSTNYTGPISGDISTLNNSGINVFSVQFGVLQNYGFVSLFGIPTGDLIYWQLNHARLRMAIVAQSYVAAQPFVFSQIDGQGQVMSAFSGALQGMLQRFFKAGALFGATPNDAFVVDTTSPNTTASIAAGQLNANLAVRMSPFAQLVDILINAVPVTQTLTQTVPTGTGS